MKKLIFIYILLFQTSLYSCATCQLMVPSAEVSLELRVNKKQLTNIDIEWKFSDLYSKELVKQYDKNQNDKLDEKELDIILNAKLNYLIPKEMLTKINYSNDTEIDSLNIKANYENFDLKMEGGLLVFRYNSNLKLNIEDKSTLSFVFEDDEGFFDFVSSSLNINDSELYHNENLYLFTATVFFSYTSLDKQEKPTEVVKEQNQTIPQEVQTPEVVEDSSMQENLLKSSIVKIKGLFEDIKDEQNPFTYIFLLFFAYIYGVVHALGPGHGKTLVGSYFLSNDRSYSKALFISLAIGVVHTFSAFLLTLIIYFIVDTFLAKFLDESIYYTTKISALIIIAIALYLLYQKYKVYKKFKNAQPLYGFSTDPHVPTCACSSCTVDNNSTDMALIISAGIIPCPGTVTIFIFSLSLGLYYAGFLSALVMSLGMSTIIFFSAILSVLVRKKTSKTNSNLKMYLEYGSLFIILTLGFILLFM
ncbi:DUF1007 family protein [Sulfurimonas sp.]|uniref:HoxN/HupN/NixA family nickel/cobalt transporter n=1 Tax=Sulfurimonas sp. TaxID=2022749 RepID=UPI00356258A5